MPSPNITITNLAAVAAARAARPAVMRPQKVNGKWHMPKMKALAVAKLRKQYIQQGRDWPWEIPHKEVEKRVAFKGKLRDLRYAQRQVDIEKSMKRMPKLIAAYRAKPKKKKAEGLALIVQETAEEAAELGRKA